MKAAGSRKTNTQGSQGQRFIETARALGCNEDEAAFKAKLAVVARQKPAKPSGLDTPPKPKKAQ